MFFIRQEPGAQSTLQFPQVQVLGSGDQGTIPEKQERELSDICGPGHWPHQPAPSERQPAPVG